MASLCKTSKTLISKSKSLFSTLSATTTTTTTTAAATHQPKTPSKFASIKEAKSAVLKESNPEKLAELFSVQCKEFARFRRDRPIFDLAAQKLARFNRYDLVKQIIETQKQAPEIASMLKSEGFWIRLIMLYAKTGMLDEAMRTFEQMAEYGCDRGTKSLCAILSAYFDNLKFNEVHELFKTLPEKIGVNACVKSHTIILKTFCKEKNVETAKIWIENMETDYGVKPDIESYNALLKTYLKIGNVSEFDHFVKEIAIKGLESNVTTYNYRIGMLCKIKECIRAKKLLAEMISKGLSPNPTSYNALIYGFCKVGDFGMGKKVLEGMIADKIVLPNSCTYNTLIEHMVKDGEYDSGLEICKEIIKRKWVPPFDVMEALVKGLVENSKVDQAEAVLKSMKARLKGPAMDSWMKIEATLPL